VITGFGLSASAGLNAYLPLLIVALIARYTELIHLRPPFDALSTGWVMGVLALLTLVEVLVDKVPAVDTINDALQTVIRPAAGAILFAAGSEVITDIHPVLAMICGILVAGTVHAVKSSTRPLVTVASAGAANPIVSTVEDGASAVISVLSIVVPIASVALIIVGLCLVLWARSRSHRDGAR
jgi:hypothetical protein